MSHSIAAFQTSVFRVKDADAFLAALAPLSSAFKIQYSDRSSGRFSLIIADDCEGWPSCNDLAYAEGKIPEDLDADDPFNFPAFLQPHLALDSACVVKRVSIGMRRGVESVHFSLDLITPISVHWFYPDNIVATLPGAERLRIEWP